MDATITKKITHILLITYLRVNYIYFSIFVNLRAKLLFDRKLSVLLTQPLYIKMIKNHATS